MTGNTEKLSARFAGSRLLIGKPLPIGIIGIEDIETKEGNGHKDKEVRRVPGEDEEHESIDADYFTQGENQKGISKQGQHCGIGGLSILFLKESENIIFPEFEQE